MKGMMTGDLLLAEIVSQAAEAADLPVAILGSISADEFVPIACTGIKPPLRLQMGPMLQSVLSDGQLSVADAPVHHSDEPLVAECGLRAVAGIPVIPEAGDDPVVLLILADSEPREEMPDLEAFGLFASVIRERVSLLHTRERLAASEERYRDLFEEAPIAYVNETLDSRFIEANRTAMNILGLRPEEVQGFVGRTLAPTTDDAQLRVDEALTTIRRGMDASGVLLNLSRKDTGEPIWIQWWSRPAPSGTYTRTMFIDVTDLVQIERERQTLKAQNAYLKEEIEQESSRAIVGSSSGIRRVLEDVRQVAPTNASVLVLGETGTGKELIARAVHDASPRREQPLIKVNCGALPESLIESELFGHEKGAFTGATAKREGRFTLADGGTLFLDEIGELPYQLQVKLLRVLQEGEFEPIGSTRTIRVDVRVIAATNRDLFQATQDGEFREDLYYRLAVFPIEVPPLRERTEDIPELVDLFTRRFGEHLNQEAVPVDEEAMVRLAGYHWPGNVRELQNVVERALITSTGGRLNLDRALPESSGTRSPAIIRTMAELHALERENLLSALDRTGWQIAGNEGAAALLGMNPSTLSSRLKALGIRRSSR